ncbi:MAG: rSAM/selenodomain-associated transferase 1 [Verrucomicrobiales bacterium]|jgi:rSAM/selenodomain-associated transferase 1
MNPLIIVFLKWPEPGQVKTRLAKSVGSEAAATIYRALVRELGHILSQCRSEDLAVCYAPASKEEAIQSWLSEEAFADHRIQHWWAQPETDLGERQAWAVDQAFAAGYDRVALLGTDCINVDQGVFQEAWKLLDESDWVFGPAEDGGYYLGATRKDSHTPREIFNEVRWSTEHTLSDCLANLEAQQGKVSILKILKDIDDYEDWISIQDRVTL